MSLLGCRIQLQWRIRELFELGKRFNNGLIERLLVRFDTNGECSVFFCESLYQIGLAVECIGGKMASSDVNCFQKLRNSGYFI